MNPAKTAEPSEPPILKKTNHLLCHYMSKTLSHVSRQNSRLRTWAGYGQKFKNSSVSFKKLSPTTDQLLMITVTREEKWKQLLTLRLQWFMSGFLRTGESYEGAWHGEGMSHEDIVATK
jgi:hypothetical protein